MWSNFNKKATQLCIVGGCFGRRIRWSGKGHEDMSSEKKYTHKSHYLNFPEPKCHSTYLTLNLLSPEKFIQQVWCVFLFNPSTPKSDWLLISPHSITHESKCRGYKNKGNDHQFKKFPIVKQILLVCSIGNVKRTVWRIWIPMS